MELGKDLILITWCETHHSSVWCFKIQNLWELENGISQEGLCCGINAVGDFWAELGQNQI